MMANAKAKFKAGDHVNHPACPNGSFPAGSGTVDSISTDPNTGECTCKVKCDKTNKVLPVDFKESELTQA